MREAERREARLATWLLDERWIVGAIRSFEAAHGHEINDETRGSLSKRVRGALKQRLQTIPAGGERLYGSRQGGGVRDRLAEIIGAEPSQTLECPVCGEGAEKAGLGQWAPEEVVLSNEDRLCVRSTYSEADDTERTEAWGIHRGVAVPTVCPVCGELAEYAGHGARLGPLFPDRLCVSGDAWGSHRATRT